MLEMGSGLYGFIHNDVQLIAESLNDPKLAVHIVVDEHDDGVQTREHQLHDCLNLKANR